MPAPATSAPLVDDRTPPYDYGCLDAPPCETRDPDAQRGAVRATTSARPCNRYAPPFVACAESKSTWTGIRLGEPATRPGQVTVRATVRRDESVPSNRLSACVHLVDHTGGAFFGGECRPLTDNRGVSLGASVNTSDSYPKAGAVYVSLEGSGAAQVESIGYTLG